MITGKSSRPYKSSLQPIADFFSVSVEQLVGEKNLPEAIWQEEQTTPSIQSDIIKSIPIIGWKQLDQLEQARKQAQKNIVTLGQISEESFALVMQDSSMEPVFTRGTILIFDPRQPAKDRGYVLVKLKENNLYLFRQLLIDGDDRYLKPLNPDLSTFKMRFLDQDDKIIGCLIESRNQHLPDDQLRLLEDI